MARLNKKVKPTKEVLTAVDHAAETTVTKEARNHGLYIREGFTERDKSGGEIDNARMRKLSPVRSLEGLFCKNPKSETAYLSNIHMKAAIRYQAIIEAAQCKYNHELGFVVDSSPNIEGRTLGTLEANDFLARLHLRMPMDYSAMLGLIFVRNPLSTMAEIWPNRTLRNNSRVIIKEALDWLCDEFGLTG